jgi:dephospho-CoA kinase
LVDHASRIPPVLGLAGGIGAGKSTVARILAEGGCVVADSDVLARHAYNDPEIRRQLVAWWGDRVRDCHACHAEPNSMPPPVDRRAIAAIVFEHPAERARLEALIHPWIARARAALFAAAPAGTRALVIDAPLLFETGLHQRCDRVIFVESSPETRFHRVRSTRGWDTAELGRREAAQWPLDRKRALADHVVHNDGDPASLRAQVRAVLDEACAQKPA